MNSEKQFSDAIKALSSRLRKVEIRPTGKLSSSGSPAPAPTIFQVGIITTEVGVKNIRVVAGKLWQELVGELTNVVFDSSEEDTFIYWYSDGAGDWTSVPGQQDIDDQHYDDGSGVLATLTDNYYGVHWVLFRYDNVAALLYGTEEFSDLEDAKKAPIPLSVPDELATDSFFIARIIIQKGSDSFAELINIYSQTLGYISTLYDLDQVAYLNRENIFVKQQEIRPDGVDKNALILRLFADDQKIAPMIVFTDPSGNEECRIHVTDTGDVFFGRLAGEYADFNTYGGYANTFLGDLAGQRITSGIYNVAIGSFAFLYSGHSSYNVVIGFSALSSLRGAGFSGNVAIGERSLSSLQSIQFPGDESGGGSNNVGVGRYAGYYRGAGTDRFREGSNCIYIGAYSRALEDEVENEIVIGYETVGHGEDTVTIGNDDITDTYLQGNVHIDSTEIDLTGISDRDVLVYDAINDKLVPGDNASGELLVDDDMNLLFDDDGDLIYEE